MKIFNISFAQSGFIKNASEPKRNNLAPLAFDTVSFEGRPKKDMPYSVFQKEKELAAIRSVLQKATENSEIINAEEISEKTGLDIYVVKLRLSTNNEIRLLVHDMKSAHGIKAKDRDEAVAKTAQEFFNFLLSTKQTLTANEMAFYLGLKKDELLDIINKRPELLSLYEASLLRIKNCPLLEKKAQIQSINKATRYITRKDTYDSLSKETELSAEIIRTRISEDDEFFSRVTEQKLYPVELYSESEIEEQDSLLMNTLLSGLKSQTKMSIEEIAKAANLYPGVVLIRFKNNTALQETYDRMHGVNQDED